MTVKAPMPVRKVNLVAPLAQKATAMHTTGTAAIAQARPGAVTELIGASLRPSDVDSANSTAVPGIRTSTTATRTTTTRAMRAVRGPSADSNLFHLLVQAYLDCRHTKRNSASAQAFEDRLEANLFELHDELASGTYVPGRSICFVVTRPKAREVWAAEFRDRIVHHLLYNQIAPRFEASFTADSCACIPGRGTLYAARRLEHQVRSVSHNWTLPASYLKCDLANFFVSINKHTLLGQLARRVTETWWLQLTETILMHDPRGNVELRGRQDLLQRVPPHKSLFNAPAGHGLPIGNLSSQFFANVLLNDLDQYAKHQLRAPHYVRYVDDFILLHPSTAWLTQAHRQIEQYLPQHLHVQLNPRKTVLQPLARGIDFVGHVIKPHCRSTRRGTVATAIRRVQETPASDLHQIANSYFGLLRQATHSHTDRARLANAVLGRGHCVNQAFTQTYQKARHAL